ncbi:cell division protein FtsI (penicillin-binding protein 3) [Silvimonas terrae]|uniref:Peptidoglycan D,D-transpeptidase FtsI n=1 Tax=Silvimonas terrae TaxID=300266 RepID=A0A840RIR8_9NEIS|nr:penicillin-binding protein 2 [Silvimonas terrae]MBB5192206.1 cell division protein FtsI (penicillin-binding protein 3) [Silvimonas terrae]
MNARISSVRPHQRHVHVLKLERWRVWAIVTLLMALFGVLLARGLYLQAFNESFLQSQGDARYTRTLKLEANRGMITDRNGDPLAISTPVQSIWCSPRGMTLLPPGQKRDDDWEPANEKDPVPVSRAEVASLGKALGMTPTDIIGRITASTKKGPNGEDIRPDFVWLKRGMAPADAKSVLALNVPGVYAQTEYRRYYPAGEVMAHIIGFTNIDGKGQEGFELTRDGMLAGKPGSRTVIRDRRGYIVEDISTIVPPRDGETLTLSIDKRIQYLAYRELKAAVEANKAVGGGIVVLDAHTGEVLALANAPSYNPNSRARIDPAARRNRALTDIYEPGSVMKPITISAVMDSGKITPSSRVDTFNGTMSIGPATIHDTHHGGVLSIAQVIQQSSNVGAARISLMMPREYMWNAYHNAGFGEVPHSGFPGEAGGILRNWKNWRPIEQATMAFGNGISVSLMQMARAYQMFADGGQIHPITFTKLVAPMPGKQVITPQSAQAMRDMMESVVQPGGTGVAARVVGYRVAGKTGTSHKLENGQYVNKYVASFIGMAPASDPRLIIAVMIDDPQGGKHFGGSVAGPVFSNVMAGSLRLLGVPPDAPTDNILLPAPDESDARE